MIPQREKCALISKIHLRDFPQLYIMNILSEQDISKCENYFDEFEKKYGARKLALPVILLKENGKLSEWISRAEINQCKSIEMLKILIHTRLQDVASKEA